MKRQQLISLALLVLCCPAAGFAAEQFSLEFLPLNGYVYDGVAPQAIVFVHDSSKPPSRVRAVSRTGNEFQIEIERSSDEAPLPKYDYALTADLPPLAAGSYQVKVVDVTSPQVPPLPPLAQRSLGVLAGGIQLEYAGAPEPGPDDEITLRLSHRPCFGQPPPRADHGDFQIRLRGGDCWNPDPQGYLLPLGRLEAGNWRIELEVGREGLHDRIELLVAEPAEPGVVLANDFEVAVSWQTSLGESGEGRLVQPPSQDSALFYFFSPANWELMIKVLDGCAINRHYWVFGAASTDVGYTVDIQRRGSTQTFRVENPIGRAAPAITDILAFPCDPAAPSATP